MTFIVVLIAMLTERFFDCSHLRNWSWFSSVQQMVAGKLTGKSADIVLAASIIPIILLVVIVQFALRNVLYGVVELIFNVVVLLYCFGPRNLWADTLASVNALMQGNAQAASERLKATFGITDMSFAQSVHRQFLDNMFTQANIRVMAVVFWYGILGPAGAVLYRLVSVVATDTTDHKAAIKQAEGILDWAPARLMTFFFALGGHFAKVFTIWTKTALTGLAGNQILLTECGIAALGYNGDDHLPEDGSAAQQALSLLDRSFILMLALILVVSIIT